MWAPTCATHRHSTAQRSALKAHKDAPAALRTFHHWVVSSGYSDRNSVMELHGDGEFIKGELLVAAKELGMKVT